MNGRRRSWSDDEFIAAVARHSNFTDVLRALGLRPAGGNHRLAKLTAARLAVDLSHFTNDRRTRGLRAIQERRRLPVEEIFCAESVVTSKVLRTHARRRLRPIECGECGNTGVHDARPLVLQLHHRNGIANDNRIENLQWLCPNCHSQSSDFAGKSAWSKRPIA